MCFVGRFFGFRWCLVGVHWFSFVSVGVSFVFVRCFVGASWAPRGFSLAFCLFSWMFRKLFIGVRWCAGVSCGFRGCFVGAS